MPLEKYIVRKKTNKSDSKVSYDYYYVTAESKKDTQLQKNNKNFKKITDNSTIEKLKKIYIAPAYKNVKIYLNKDILATGIDTAGRKQYVYSEERKKKRNIDKYNRISELSKNISRLKKSINNDLIEKTYSKNKVIAVILKIMDFCNFRCGNKKYEKMYGSYGLTTLHKKHFKFKKDEIEIDFIGKKGVRNYCIIKDKSLQSIIKDVYKRSSKDDPYIFNIINEKTNEKIIINITDVNKYLERFNVTSKDLRTWNANIIFLKSFKLELDKLNDDLYYKKKSDKKLKLRKKMIKEAIKNTAIKLHNTPAVCKSSYIFKSIVNSIEDGFINLSIFKKNFNSEALLKNIMHI
jgi:DNA topoisomerase-1